MHVDIYGRVFWGLAAIVPVVDFQEVSYTLGLGNLLMLLMDQIQPSWWYVIWVYVIQDFFTVFLSTPLRFFKWIEKDEMSICHILLTKNLNHQNTPWNTLSPSPHLHKLLHGIGDTVIFLSLKPAGPHGRSTPNKVLKMKWKNVLLSSSNPSGNLSNCSPCRKDKQQKGTIFKGASSSKNLSDPKRHFSMSYTGSCVAIDSCEVTCWTWPS